MLVGWLIMELLANITINIILGLSNTTWASFGKGVLERLFLIVGILAGYPHVIIAFGALKIGTRVHEDKDSKISNNYFLVGNFISLLATIIYVYICLNFLGWE
jgi:hypothetical protein